MSNATKTPPTIRWQLLSTVSAFALIASSYAAQAGDDRPALWIELGGQMENVSGQGEVFAPTFLSVYPTSPVLQKVTPLEAQQPPSFSFGEEARISFQPDTSDWLFSASLRYGRSSNFRHVHHQTDRVFSQPFKYGTGTAITTVEKFADTTAQHRESHAILDFSAGKDVGLGLFGAGSSSRLNIGLRFAQFASKASFDLRARPDLRLVDPFINYFPPSVFAKYNDYFHTYHASGRASRSFRGVGPSLSWSGSAPFVGNVHNGEVVFDWGANASLLFGKQRAVVTHQESGHYKNVGDHAAAYQLLYQNPVDGHADDRSVTVPNLGGFAGFSWRKENFKVSTGYRADIFFNAIDGGIDARKSENRGFFGPYASISIGLGD